MRTEKITPTSISGIKTLIESSISQSKIAEIYGVSLCTIQTVKRTGFNYKKYKKYTSDQFDKWKIRQSKKDNNIDSSVFGSQKTYKTGNDNKDIAEVHTNIITGDMYNEILNRLENIENTLKKVFNI
tara:strand:+ start:201 stop:581 length:381 start_codon:yes stop_codon:yes gene_type:complete